MWMLAIESKLISTKELKAKAIDLEHEKTEVAKMHAAQVGGVE
jgi:hypothetical protein